MDKKFVHTFVNGSKLLSHISENMVWIQHLNYLFTYKFDDLNSRMTLRTSLGQKQILKFNIFVGGHQGNLQVYVGLCMYTCHSLYLTWPGTTRRIFSLFEWGSCYITRRYMAMITRWRLVNGTGVNSWSSVLISSPNYILVDFLFKSIHTLPAA